MGSPHDSTNAHWGHEPEQERGPLNTLNDAKRGISLLALFRVFSGQNIFLHWRFMGSADAKMGAYRAHEPVGRDVLIAPAHGPRMSCTFARRDGDIAP